MNSKLINQMAIALAEVDFSDENARIAEIRDDIAKTGIAMQKAEARITEINQAINDAKGPDARAVADALLTGVSAMEAATVGPTRGEMDAEKTSLRAGIRDLHHRMQDAYAEIEGIEGAAFGRLASAVAPVIDALFADAQAAAQRVIEAYAGLSAVVDATKAGRRELNKVEKVVRVINRQDGLLSMQTIDVPGEILEALHNLAGKGAALKPRFYNPINVPF